MRSGRRELEACVHFAMVERSRSLSGILVPVSLEPKEPIPVLAKQNYQQNIKAEKGCQGRARKTLFMSDDNNIVALVFTGRLTIPTHQKHRPK